MHRWLPGSLPIWQAGSMFHARVHPFLAVIPVRRVGVCEDVFDSNDMSDLHASSTPEWDSTLGSRHASVRLYDGVFLFAYLANVFVMMAISLMFRYSEFVKYLGGGEDWLGAIIGFGAIGAIVLRLFQAVAIDRFGAIWVWGLSLVGMATSVLLHLWIDQIGWQVFLVRLCLHTSIAGVMGGWLSFVSLRAQEHYMAEIIGVVGTSGFVGMAIGPTLGDWVFSGAGTQDMKVSQMFLLTAGCTGLAGLCALGAGFLSRHEPCKVAHSRLSMWQAVREYHPGFLLLVAAMMGIVISMPGNFLRPFAESLQIDQIMVFFLTYNLVAFVSRLYFRKHPVSTVYGR